MKTTILQLIDEAIARELDYIKEHDQIKAILKPLEGQSINGRTLNKKRLSAFDVDNGYTYTLVPQYGMFYIRGKYDHLIGYDSEPIISIESATYSRGFEYFDACHGRAAQERISQLERLDIDMVVKVFTAIKGNFEALCVMFGEVERLKLGSFYNPIYYDILRAIKPDDSKSGDRIKLSDFYYLRK